MKLSATQRRAVRKFAQFHPKFMALWRSERLILKTNGIHRVTLESLARLGIVERGIDTSEAGSGRVFRLTPLAVCLIQAVRGDA